MIRADVECAGKGGSSVDIEGNIAAFMGGRLPDARYTSFDYCFNYFQPFRDQDRTKEIAARANMQVSCLHLGFYLASWGMFRALPPCSSRASSTMSP
jgi:hypothetical protein